MSSQFPNLNIGIPPFQTPITVGGDNAFGVPFQNRPKEAVPAGQLHPAWFGWFNQVGRIVGQVPTISGLAAAMVPSGGGTATTDYTPDGWQRFVYYQTDTRLMYISMLVADLWEWVLVSSSVTVADLATMLALPVGPAEAGLIVFELEYFHTYEWTGTAWQFAPGDPGSKYIVAGVTAPLGGVWQLCDGTAVNVSQGDGTVASVTTPNLNTAGFSSGPVLIGGGGTGFQAATVPSWQAAAKTDNESAHTHPITAALVVQSGAGSSPAATGNTGAGTAHNHTLSDANALLKKPSDGTDATHGGGMPDRFYLNWYMRR